MPTLKHPHSPKSPPSATGSAATKMLDGVISSRRVALFSDDDDGTAISDTDESKNKRQSPYLMASNCLSRFSQFCCLCPAPLACLLLCLILAFVSLASLLFHSRSIACVSPASRVGFFGLDGLDSDFGSLGVPWCKSCFSHR
uniref:Uncharacterized protein n=1 Tax=Rhizophora mucronata TaxID=61149 RepID=A0A2P2IMF2_RHIMU